MQTAGGIVAAFVPFQTFLLPKQGAPYSLKRVYFQFENDGSESGTWYFSLIARNGENVEMVRITSTESESPGAPPTAIDGGAMHFFGEAEFRSHIDGASIMGFAGTEQLMTAPVGCDGIQIDTNDTVEIVFRCSLPAGLGTPFTVKNIYWHCDFDFPKKS